MVASEGLPYLDRDSIRNGSVADEQGFPSVAPTRSLDAELIVKLGISKHRMQWSDGVTAIHKAVSQECGQLLIKTLA